MFYIKHIKNSEHYDFLVNYALKKAEKYVWIGTADIKDLYYKSGNKAYPLLREFEKLVLKGVKLRLLHAKEPGKRFIEDFDKYPALAKLLERALCIRVHFKIIVVDGKFIYTGSANLTGAAFGMRSENSRNFESGIHTNDPEIVESVAELFDKVWRGEFCPKCKLRKDCPDVIDI